MDPPALRSAFPAARAVFLAGVSYESDRDVARQSTPVPDLDPSRRVLEQDCTKAIEDWSANLKCR